MKCPTCFAWLPTSPTKRLCVGSCDPGPLDPASLVLGYDVTSKPVFDAPAGAGPTACPICSVPSSQEACGYCLAPIPADWRDSTVTCVVMAGARATGKSITLATAKEQLNLLIDRHYHSYLRGIGNTDEVFARYYTRPLYEQRSLLDPTASIDARDTVTREPLIFQFHERSPEGVRRSRILVLRDVAGEDLEALGARDRGLSFFSRADAVISLLDPLRVPQINAMLADLVPGDTRVGGDGIPVLKHVLRLMANGSATGRTSIPLAVVLSKVDTLQMLRLVDDLKWSSIMNRPGSPLQRDPSLRSADYDEVDGELLHEEVRGLLELLNSTNLTAILEEGAEKFRFFAGSALGASPDGPMVAAGGIAPFRVVDPFKWVLQVTA